MEENNINEILGIDSTNSHSVEARTFNRNRYPALKTISAIYLVLAWIVGIAAIIFTFYFLSEDDTQIYGLVSVVLGGLLVLGLAAIAETIKVFLDIEYNTRKGTDK